MQPLALYIHWPYCLSKCPYCDFNSHVAASIDQAAFRAAYERELTHYAALLPDRTITSVFFGGGTPSLMEPATTQHVIDTIARLWRVNEDAEITLEANPNSVEAGKFTAFRTAGINRLSLGIQALNDADLKFLGRGHNVAEGKAAIDLASKHFTRFSYDLIYARQGQSLKSWESELREALSLADAHLSLYQLTIEPSTQFYTRANRGETLTAPDDDAAAMYELTQDIMSAAGLPAYEISNHARVGQESRHNLTYWRYRDYLGIGPGAHGRYQQNGRRLATDNHRAPEVWLREVVAHNHGQRESLLLDQTTAMREALMMGLRLTAGIDRTEWHEQFGGNIDVFLPVDKIKRLVDEDYMRINEKTLQATHQGLQRLNAVLDYLLN